MSRSTGVSRRGLLGVALATGLAGCTLPGDTDEEEYPKVDVDFHALASMIEEEPPTIDYTVPVEVDEEQVSTYRKRAKELVAPIPAELEADIPNGLIREEVADNRNRVTDQLAAPGDATSYDRLQTLHGTLGDAGMARGTYAASVENRSHRDILDEWPGVEEAATALAETWTYVSGDPLQAVLVHSEIEALEADAVESNRQFRSPPQDPTETGDALGAIERSRAQLQTARHLAVQYEASIEEPDELTRLADVVERAIAQLDGQIETYSEDDLEGAATFFDRSTEEIEQTPAHRFTQSVLWEMGDNLDAARSSVGEDAIATATLELADAKRDQAALGVLDERIDGTWFETVDDVSLLRESRTRAVSAIETALDETNEISTARRLLSPVEWEVDSNDRMLEYDPEQVDEIGAWNLDRAFARYEWAAAQASVVPDTIEWLETLLEDA
jgi:hypothetical protein